jgi:hypothetical protein
MREVTLEKLKQYLAPMEKQCFAPRSPIGFSLPHGEAFDGKINELMSLLGLKTKAQLADFLSVEAEEINIARAKREIPPNWLVRLWEVANQVK